MSAAHPPLEVTLDLTPEEAFTLACDGVREWGGEVEPGRTSWSPEPTRIQLPVSAGLRYGWIDAFLRASAEGSGSRISLQVEENHYRLHVPAMVILLLGGLGGLSMLVIPLFPPLLDLLPLAALLLLLSWFMVASKVKNRSAQDFLDELAESAQSLED